MIMALKVKVCIFIVLCVFFKKCCSITDSTCTKTICPYTTECKNEECVCQEGFTKVNCSSKSDVCWCPDGQNCTYGNCSCADVDVFFCDILPSCDSHNISIACKHNGSCVVNGDQPYCICPPNMNMTDCTPNRCDENPCKSGRCIAKSGNDYDCRCEDGGVGKMCGINKKCIDGYCANGGTCYENIYARCRCMAGYIGPRCEENTTATACDTLGSLSTNTSSEQNSTQCNCRKIFKGKTCALLDCESYNPCTNSGLCYSDPEVPTRHYCYCQEGWTGSNCESDINECLSNPCGNGTCINKDGTFECMCADNSTGLQCETDLHTCFHPEKCSKVARNGICEAECNHKNCNFDGGDCISDDPWVFCNETKGYCRTLSRNSMCDNECNNEGCLYDLGSCSSMDMNTTCPLNCTDSWADDTCQSECNTSSCGYDGSDCQDKDSEDRIIGTLVVTYFSKDRNAYKAIGQTLSYYSGAILGLNGKIEPTNDVKNMTQESRYTAFFSVRNSPSCSNISFCWSSADSLSKFSAALYINNEMLFKYNTEQIVFQHVVACQNGYYGENCDLPCPKNCNGTQACDLVTGSCPHGCMGSYYGIQCEMKCSANCAMGCEQMGGNCSGAQCKVGYHGAMCGEMCPSGKYGVQCEQMCNPNCRTGSCNHISGLCDSCKRGYQGQQCSEECKNGTYGYDCGSKCGKCANYTSCNSVDGSCPNGCSEGYTGTECKTCGVGHYGTACDKTCLNCVNNECRGDGTCRQGCKSGFTGASCQAVTESPAEPSNASTITAVIIVLLILITLAGVFACILWRRDQAGSYELNEKKDQSMPMKKVNEEEMAKKFDEFEPLVGVTPTDKSSPDAKLVIESEGVDPEHHETQENERKSNASKDSQNSLEDSRSSKTSESKPDTARSSKSSDSKHMNTSRSSKTSDFRPESIHGNGPGGVYVGGSSPLETRNTHGNRSDDENENKNEEEATKDCSVDENSDQEKDTKADGSGDGSTNRSSSDQNDEQPVTTVDSDGLIKTEQL